MFWKTISTGELRERLKPFNYFRLEHDDPLSPLGVGLTFNHAAVCIGACPYISLRNTDMQGDEKNYILIHHIKTITTAKKGNLTFFYIKCLQYYTETPESVTLKLICV